MTGDVLLRSVVAEDPVFFEAGGETLFGLHCPAPSDRPSGLSALVVSGGLLGTSTVGRNRFFVRLARGLADRGHATFRFDYHGIGESTGLIERFTLEDPFVDDVLGAAHWMTDNGHARIVVIGKCFGSRSVLSSAHALPALEGLVLIGLPVKDFERGERQAVGLAQRWTLRDYARRARRAGVLKGLADPRRRKAYVRFAQAKLTATLRRIRRRPPAATLDTTLISANFMEPFEALVRRQVPVLMIWGDRDEFWSDFQNAAVAGPLRRALDLAGPRVEVATLPGKVRGFEQVANQAPLVEVIEEWMSRLRTTRP